MGHYPPQPASQSSLRIACVFDARTGSSMVASAFTIHDFDVAVYHNGAARTITNTASIASGATTFTAANCTGITAWVNRPIAQTTGTNGIAARTFVTSISGACLVTLNKATTASIPAATSFKLDNATARSVADGVTTLASFTVTSATANFTAADVGKSIDGTNIPANSTISVFNSATSVDFTNGGSNPATATGSAQVLTFGGTLLVNSTRVANDATFVSATQITSTAAKFNAAADVGLPVYGANIAQPAYITAVAGATITLSNTVTSFVGTEAITIGDPSVTAPANGEAAVYQGVQLDLDPTLVAGSDPCSDDTAEGFALVGTWLNPGSFFSNVFATQPAATRAIGEIKFPTGVGINYAAYVIQRGALTAGDPQGAAHYDLVFPNVPTGLALCLTATSPGLGLSIGVIATTPTVETLAAGVGRPGTAQLRSLIPTATGGYSSTIFIDAQAPAGIWTGPNFNRLVIYPAGPPVITFQFGVG